MAWIAAAASVAGAAIQANGRKSAAEQMGVKSDNRTSEAVFDNSGWNVSFGSSRIDSTAVKTVDQNASQPSGLGSASSFLPSLGQLSPDEQKTMLYVAIGAVVLIAWKRKKK